MAILKLQPKRVYSLALMSLLFASILSMISVDVRAHGIVDQQCTTVGGGYLDGIGAYEPAGQTFKPSQTSVIGFSIHVRSVNGVPTPMHGRIRVGGIGGAIIGTADFSIPAAFGGAGGDWFHVHFPSGVTVTPGSTYALDLDDTLASSGIKWNGCTDSYAGGSAYSSGMYNIVGADWSFIIYAGDFSISLSSGSLSVAQGASGAVTVTVTSINNFNSPVTLTVTGQPAGVTPTFSSNPVTPPAGGSTTSILTLAVAGSVPTGAYGLTVTGTSGPLSHSAVLTLTVTPAAPAPDFSISSSAATMAIAQGASGSATITVSSLNGFSSAVALSGSWVGTAPSGVTFSLPSPVTPPSGGSATSPLTMTATSSASTGSFTFRVTGTSGALTHSTDITVQITAAAGDFTITVTPASLSLLAGASGASTVMVQSTGAFSSPVTLTTLGAPAGATLAFGTNPLTPPAGGTAASLMTVALASGILAGTYAITVRGTSGALTHDASITIQVLSTATTATPTATVTTTAPGGPRCFIATATFGSELSPEVQFLRGFRDNSILATYAGSNFMVAFNAWYYSFSPSVAQFVAEHSTVSTAMKFILYPLIGILRVGAASFYLFPSNPEVGAVVAGLAVSALMGAVYLASPTAILLSRTASGRRMARRMEKPTVAVLIAALGIIGLAEAFGAFAALMVIATSTVVLAMLLASTLLASRAVLRLAKRL